MMASTSAQVPPAKPQPIRGMVTSGVGTASLLYGIEARANRPGSGGEFLMIYGGLSLAVGLPLLAYGLLSPRDVYVRDAVAPVALGFSLSRRQLGAGLTLAF